jgi:hypothetical protein
VIILFIDARFIFVSTRIGAFQAREASPAAAW